VRSSPEEEHRHLLGVKLGMIAGTIAVFVERNFEFLKALPAGWRGGMSSVVVFIPIVCVMPTGGFS